MATRCVLSGRVGLEVAVVAAGTVVVVAEVAMADVIVTRHAEDSQDRVLPSVVQTTESKCPVRSRLLGAGTDSGICVRGRPLPFRPLIPLEVGSPLNQLEGLGACCKLRLRGPRQSRSRKRTWCTLKL